jgi:hypothetical protein
MVLVKLDIDMKRNETRFFHHTQKSTQNASDAKILRLKL